jgi:hypothetical protein
MHLEPSLDGEHCRVGVLRQENEEETAYVTALKGDVSRSIFELETITQQPVYALAYPHGVYNLLAQVVLSQAGVRVTLTTEVGTNTLVKGLPQSLLNLKNSEHE